MADRGDTHPNLPGASIPQTLRRRGMLTAVAALAAGGLAKATTSPALAGTDGDLVLNTTNNATSRTTLQVTPGLSFPSSELLLLDSQPDLAGGTAALRALGSNGGNLAFAATGIVARGGNGVATAPGGGTGISTTGGNGGTAGAGGADGLVALGGNGVAPNGTAGHGIEAFGGPAAGTSIGGSGVRGAGAGTGATGGNGVVGINNSSANAAVSGQNNGSGEGVFGNSATGIGVRGTSPALTGVHGTSNSGVGVRGDSGSGPGVVGTTVTNHGVFGDAAGGNGVFGRTVSGAGVFGQGTTTGNGLQGLATSGSGVHGSANSGFGVFGTSGTNAGVAGQSASNNAVFGDSSSNGNGLFGRTVNGNGLVAQATGGGNAAQFFGNVIVQGNFTVAPGFAKSGTVAFPDGTVRRLYATEAPESWFEDYGEAQLVNGRASVPIPQDFALAVNTSVPYHVFTESHTTEIEALAVTVRAADHFEVEANGKGQVTGSFSYRLVAKRKDVAGPRFERVTLGAAPTVPALDAAAHAPAAAPTVKLPDLPAGAQQIPPVLPVPEPPAERQKPGR